jgi:hypothetical protein
MGQSWNQLVAEMKLWEKLGISVSKLHTVCWWLAPMLQGTIARKVRVLDRRVGS